MDEFDSEGKRYQLNHTYQFHVETKYEACFRDNLHSIWAYHELYRRGKSKEEFYHVLEKNMLCVICDNL